MPCLEDSNPILYSIRIIYIHSTTQSPRKRITPPPPAHQPICLAIKQTKTVDDNNGGLPTSIMANARRLHLQAKVYGEETQKIVEWAGYVARDSRVRREHGKGEITTADGYDEKKSQGGGTKKRRRKREQKYMHNPIPRKTTRHSIELLRL